MTTIFDQILEYGLQHKEDCRFDSHHVCTCGAIKLACDIRELVSTPTNIDEFPRAKSISDEMMDVVDRLGAEYDRVDIRVWDHMLVYAPLMVIGEVKGIKIYVRSDRG